MDQRLHTSLDVGDTCSGTISTWKAETCIHTSFVNTCSIKSLDFLLWSYLSVSWWSNSISYI